MRALRSALAATALTVAAGLSPAQAAAAPGDRCPTGVTVVVDPGALGGAVTEECVEGAGGLTAAEVMQRAGHELGYVQGQSFVCRLDDRPDPAREACVRIPPADAYWGLFWAENVADGGVRWTYATLGVTALTVPAGGAVGWRWQDGGEREEPPALSDQDPPDQDPPTSPAVPGAAQGEEPAATAEASSVPGWVAVPAVLGLAGAAVVVARRRRS